nr:MAG TPA: hypothetical protein [Caudoviricetes sp.]
MWYEIYNLTTSVNINYNSSTINFVLLKEWLLWQRRE